MTLFEESSMTVHTPAHRKPGVLYALTIILLLGPAAGSHAEDSQPVVENSPTEKALAALPPKPLEERVPVTIYEFHSGVPAVSVVAATDMFTTALVRSAQFRVVERQRLNQGVLFEKQLNAAGQTTGDTAQKQLRGARYIFEGTVSEANASADQHQGGVNVGGLNLGGGHNKDTIAVDVRILDADTGDVLDAVSVSKALDDSSTSLSGTAALAAMRGRIANPLTPDVNYQSSHQESVDKALRSCIEASVLALVKRVGTVADAGNAR
jgi:curli biogenesis system outer membrane secretion channel CsgG